MLFRSNVLQGRHVLAVAGTHGKTTTTSMLTWILEAAGLQPGFLIGGVPQNFGISARLGAGKFFVIEADEYDTAFFDKRSKFVHYGARTAILNNIEFDHADIFPDLAAIEQQFHHLVRTIPGRGWILANGADAALDRVLAKGCWSEQERFGGDKGRWQAGVASPDGAFEVALDGRGVGIVQNRRQPTRCLDIVAGSVGGDMAEHATGAASGGSTVWQLDTTALYRRHPYPGPRWFREAGTSSNADDRSAAAANSGGYPGGR